MSGGRIGSAGLLLWVVGPLCFSARNQVEGASGQLRPRIESPPHPGHHKIIRAQQMTRIDQSDPVSCSASSEGRDPASHRSDALWYRIKKLHIDRHFRDPKHKEVSWLCNTRKFKSDGGSDAWNRCQDR
jgi:hypothetical protein